MGRLRVDVARGPGRSGWLAHPADPRAAEVRDWLDRRLREYVRDYRGVLGLAYLVLAR